MNAIARPKAMIELTVFMGVLLLPEATQLVAPTRDTPLDAS